MLTKTVDIYKTKVGLQDLISLVISGTEILFVEDDTPLARLIPIGQRVAGLHHGAILTSESFDEPLPEDFWTQEQ